LSGEKRDRHIREKKMVKYPDSLERKVHTQISMDLALQLVISLVGGGGTPAIGKRKVGEKKSKQSVWVWSHITWIPRLETNRNSEGTSFLTIWTRKGNREWKKGGGVRGK